jgi:hypothetical protein
MTTSKLVESLDLEVLGRFWSDYYRVGMDRAAQQRARIPAERVFDLSFRRSASRAGAKGDPHVYSLEAFGLDGTSLQQKFWDYESHVESLAQPPRDAE